MKKPAKAWKPKTAAEQVKAHHKAVDAKRKRDAHPVAAKAKAVERAKKTLAAARKETTKVRKWTPDGDIALCSARAVAESLRIALGVPVSHDDVLALYWHVARDPDAGASILATLSAARDHGLAGYRPAFAAAGMHEANERLILGVDLPAAGHAVALDGPVWWSWGEPYDAAAFPGAVVDEAWAVTWA